eukprot:542074_1
MNNQKKRTSSRKSTRLREKQQNEAEIATKTPSKTSKHSITITTQKKKRKRSKSIGRKHKKTPKSYSQGGQDNISRAEHRQKQREEYNKQRRRDRKTATRVKKEQEDKYRKELQEKNDLIIAYEAQQTEQELVSCEIVSNLLFENETILKQRNILRKQLKVSQEQSDKCWGKLQDILVNKQDDEYVYMEETNLDDDQQEEKTNLNDEQSHDFGEILYQMITNNIWGAQSKAVKKFRRWAFKIILMTCELVTLGTAAENIPPSIKCVLVAYLPFDFAQKLKVPSARIIRHWTKHHIKFLNDLVIKKKVSNIPKKELVTSGTDGAAVHSNKFQVAAVSYKEAKDLVENNQKALQQRSENNEEEVKNDAANNEAEVKIDDANTIDLKHDG